MLLEVEMISKPDELESVEPFRVDKLLWGTKKIPDTYGYLGFVPQDGFYLKMVCEEADPLRQYKEDKDPVYRDSAMEAFLMFEPAKNMASGAVYINLEANANGALLAAFGKERTYRTYFTAEEYEAFSCKAETEEGKWSVSLHIPLALLEQIYGPLCLEEGSVFSCNFYKISETKEIEHYASFSPILTDIPSFHLPEYFAPAVLVKRKH
ncbi:carbohydrate-binding family 9-like protein [Faecalicatena contorta]|uniref:carbohydrate-binding family 9-like protein n=1 Tax=Faecalicatena contorta TaxID=39482 RepID=UPI001F268253|nr:carbohydrate-binding family 9-like protein [Faecalicatena contorta]MCF2555520.1 carbohydrate-binding family 9-like protein [Faecalicatena contorta]MCF2679888.1 carbohydrate-binding family 9-like protein [Faecalicatena contorta]